MYARLLSIQSRIFCFLLMLVLSACSVVPASGPSGQAFKADSAASEYLIVPLTQQAVDVAAASAENAKLSSFDTAGKKGNLLGSGDTIRITIFEASAGGLFSQQASTTIPVAQSTVLPDQVIGSDGSIKLPYVGRVDASNVTPGILERRIEKLLDDKAIEPQVIVSVINSLTNTVSIVGKKSGRIRLSEKGTTVLDAISEVGAINDNLHNGYVTLSRNGRNQTVRLVDIINAPEENIYLHPNDVIALSEREQTFTALGATGKNELVPFNLPQLTLVQALGRVGGLQEFVSDPQSVFLLRFESVETAQKLAGAPAMQLDTLKTVHPVVYHADLSSPRAYFLAAEFEIRDGDILYVSPSQGVTLQKIIGLLLGVTSVEDSI